MVDTNKDAMKNIQPSEKNEIELLKMVHDHFLQDIREFWSRSNFYLIVQVGLVSVFVSLSTCFSQFLLTVKITLGVLGIFLAMFWFVVMRGAVHWIFLWRKKLIELDEIIDHYRAFSTTESQGASNLFLSPSYITSWLPLLFLIVWLVLIISLVIGI